MKKTIDSNERLRNLITFNWKFKEFPKEFLKAYLTFNVNVTINKFRITFRKANGFKFTKKGIPHSMDKTESGHILRDW